MCEIMHVWSMCMHVCWICMYVCVGGGGGDVGSGIELSEISADSS